MRQTVGIVNLSKNLAEIEYIEKQLIRQFHQSGYVNPIQCDENNRLTALNSWMSLHSYWVHDLLEMDGYLDWNETDLISLNLLIIAVEIPDRNCLKLALALAQAAQKSGAVVVAILGSLQKLAMLNSIAEIRMLQNGINSVIWVKQDAHSSQNFLKSLIEFVKVIHICNDQNAIISVDWEDVSSVLSINGKTQICFANASGPQRAVRVVTSVLLDQCQHNQPGTMKAYLAHICGPRNLTLSETRIIMSTLRNGATDGGVCAFICSHEDSLIDQLRLTILSKSNSCITY